MSMKSAVLISILALSPVAPMFAQSADSEFFEKSVRPIFAKNCYSCHGPATQSSGLNLSTEAGFSKARIPDL